MLLTSEPGRTFAIGLEGKGLEPERGEPAFFFRYLSGREARACRDLDEKIPTIGMTNEQAIALYAMLRTHLAGWEHIVIKGKPVTFSADGPDLADILTDGEAKRLFARMLAANELHPDTLKNFASPSAGSTEKSAAANAETAKDLPTQR
jgi:hypothetical protein